MFMNIISTIPLVNILPSESMEHELSDFGLVKMLNMEESKFFADFIMFHSRNYQIS
ncbi:hypothetical protein Sjap_008185 [Stephania japonica]|uniref:Uncharacterized protein n=1 Tax=Stephania japonica TaxID=461633 RepID=A0AAP0PE82_9MAGN